MIAKICEITLVRRLGCIQTRLCLIIWPCPFFSITGDFNQNVYRISSANSMWSYECRQDTTAAELFSSISNVWILGLVTVHAQKLRSKDFVSNIFPQNSHQHLPASSIEKANKNDTSNDIEHCYFNPATTPVLDRLLINIGSLKHSNTGLYKSEANRNEMPMSTIYY